MIFIAVEASAAVRNIISIYNTSLCACGCFFRNEISNILDIKKIFFGIAQVTFKKSILFWWGGLEDVPLPCFCSKSVKNSHQKCEIINTVELQLFILMSFGCNLYRWYKNNRKILCSIKKDILQNLHSLTHIRPLSYK